jgi:hypothetical protein
MAVQPVCCAASGQDPVLWERVRSSCWSAPMLEVRVAFVWCEWRVPAGLEVWSCIVWQGGAEVVGLAPVVSKCLPGRVVNSELSCGRRGNV